MKNKIALKNQDIEGIFFDLDGTLMDTADDFIFVVNQLQSDHGRPHTARDIIRKNVSAGSAMLTSIALDIPLSHCDIEIYRKQLLKHYATHINNIHRTSPATLYPGIKDLLNELEHKGISWGIVTNKPVEYAIPLLKQVKLHDRSNTTICPEHVKKPKPDPQALLLACLKAKCLPERSIYIGDHKRDIDAGKQAGMTTIAALYGYISDNDNPAIWEAYFQAKSVNEIHQWLADRDWKI